jgi:hypothetical protein
MVMVFFFFFLKLTLFTIKLIGSYYYIKATDVLKQQQEFVKYFSDSLNRKLTILAQKVTATLEVYFV